MQLVPQLLQAEPARRCSPVRPRTLLLLPRAPRAGQHVHRPRYPQPHPAEISGAYCKNYIAEVFPHRSTYLLDESLEVNSLFRSFLEYYTELTMDDILPGVQFVSKYFSLQFAFESPSVLKNNINSILKVPPD